MNALLALTVAFCAAVTIHAQIPNHERCDDSVCGDVGCCYQPDDGGPHFCQRFTDGSCGLDCHCPPDEFCMTYTGSYVGYTYVRYRACEPRQS